MEPTPTPENGRQSRGLARFWPVHGMPVPVQRQSDEDPGAQPPGGGAAGRQQADDPQRTDGPGTGLPGVQQMTGSHPRQSNPAGTPQRAETPFPARQVSGPQGSVPQGSVPQGSGPQGSVPQGSGPQGSGPQGSGPQGSGPQGSGLLLPNGRPAGPQSPEAPSPLDSGAQSTGDASGDRQEGPREPTGFGPSAPHPALTSDTQMVALGSRRGLFGAPQEGEQTDEPAAPNGTQARGWTGNQPGYPVDGDRTQPGQHNGDLPRHSSVPSGPANGLPGAAPNRLPPAVSPAVGPAGSSPVRPVSPGVAPVRPVSAAGPVSNGRQGNGGPRNGQHADGHQGNGPQGSRPLEADPFRHDPLGNDSLGRHPFGGGPVSSAGVSSDVPGSGRGSAGASAPLPVSPAPVVSPAPASRPVSSQPVPVVRVDTAPVDLTGTDVPQREGSPEPIGGPDRVPASGRIEMSGRVAMSGRRSRDDDGYDSRSDRPAAPPRRSADPDDAQHQPGPSGRADEHPMRPGDVEQTRITLWDDAATRQFHDEWHEVKAQFVDDPVAALTRAHDLLTEAVHELTESLLAERDDLDPLRRTSTPDTESMRMAMRGYREFLDRIMAL
jgi:hypothetical protein